MSAFDLATLNLTSFYPPYNQIVVDVQCDIPITMPLVTCDPDNPEGARFTVVGARGHCGVLIERGGRCTLSFNSQHDLNDMLDRLSLNQNERGRTVNRRVVVVESDDEDAPPARPVRPVEPRTPQTPTRRSVFSAVTPRSSARLARTPVSGNPVHRPPSPTPTRSNQPSLLLSPIALQTPPNSPTSFISSPSTLTDATLSPLVFAPAPETPATIPIPVPDPLLHPTASFDGHGQFRPSDWAVPQAWLRIYRPWSPRPKVGNKWHVVFIGFEVGVFWDSWDHVQPLVCLPHEKKGYADAKFQSFAGWGDAVQAFRRGPVRVQAYPFPR